MARIGFECVQIFPVVVGALARCVGRLPGLRPEESGQGSSDLLDGAIEPMELRVIDAGFPDK
jgi:hypothetical protein